MMRFVNGSIVDVLNGEILPNRSIDVDESGNIRSIDSNSHLTHLPPSQIVDLQGRYVLPGIISCHSHLSIVFPFSDTDVNEDPAVTAFRSAVRAKEALDAGITTLRSVHEQNRIDFALRHARNKGWIEAPRIFGAGRAISTPHGHGEGNDCSFAEGELGFYEAALQELAAGADHIKIFINGGLARAGESPDKSEMSDQEIAGAVRAAREKDSYVVAHSGESTAILQALKAGVRSFEHIYHLNQDVADAMAAAGAFATPTLCVTRSESWMRAKNFAEGSIQNAINASEEHLASVKRAIKAGIPLVNGTDYPPGDVVDGIPAAIHELFLMHDAGLSPLQALQSISTTAARLLNQSRYLGQVAPGFAADFITVKENPLTELDTLRQVCTVIQSGKVMRDNFN